jgi:hypothetical protein
MADTPAQEAAAGVLGDFVETEAQLNELLPDPGEIEPLIPNEATEAEADVEQPQDDETLPEINWETPDEIRELLETPDFEDDDDEPEVEFVAQQDDDEYDDPEKAQMRKQLAKMQKKLAWAEEQKAKASRKEWAAEAKRYFQFSNPDVIEAKSRRAFLKEAQRQNEAVAAVAKPLYEKLQAEKAQLKEQALAEARAEAEKRWGAPSAGPTTASNYEENTQTNQRERLRQGQGLVSVIKQKGYLKNL